MKPLYQLLPLIQLLCFFFMALGYPLAYLVQACLCLIYICIYISRQKLWGKIFEVMQRVQRALYQWYRNRQAPRYRRTGERQKRWMKPASPQEEPPSRYEDQPQVMYPQAAIRKEQGREQ
jgi:hypothetical protein